MTRTTPIDWNALFLPVICGVSQPLHALLFFKASMMQISWLAGAGCPGLLSLTLQQVHNHAVVFPLKRNTVKRLGILM